MNGRTNERTNIARVHGSERGKVCKSAVRVRAVSSYGSQQHLPVCRTLEDGLAFVRPSPDEVDLDVERIQGCDEDGHHGITALR